MKNIKLTIEYDGTNYCGWQKQTKQITVQEELEKAIADLTKDKNVKLIGCSRTDSGVHAKEYIANFHTNSNIPGEKFSFALNHKLPKDIVILKSEEVDENFHSRYNTVGKTYVYTIFSRPTRAALYRRYGFVFSRELDIENMKKACKYFIGTHDFSAFKTKGSSAKTNVRTIKELNIENQDGCIKIKVTGDGFLYNMVRIIVGTLLNAGVGKINPEYIKVILDSKDRNKAGIVVPGNGLCLYKVFY